jgi:GntR family transcriptional regulator
MEPLSREDAVSLHEQIRRSILADIWRGLYNPGDLLPSEKELSTRFGVNRLTVRQAVHALANQGHVRPLKGRGYQVRSNVLSADALTVISLSRYLQEVGLETETKLLDTSVVPAVPEVADALGIHPGSQVIQITRVRLVLNSPIVVEEAFYDAEKFEHLLDVDLSHKSLIDTLFREFDLRIGRVAAELKAGLAGQRGEALGLTPESPVLIASIVMYDLDDSPVELGIAYYHSDRARMTVTSPVDPGTWPYGDGLK